MQYVSSIMFSKVSIGVYAFAVGVCICMCMHYENVKMCLGTPSCRTENAISVFDNVF